MESRKLDLPSW